MAHAFSVVIPDVAKRRSGTAGSSEFRPGPGSASYALVRDDRLKSLHRSYAGSQRLGNLSPNARASPDFRPSSRIL